MRSREHVIKDLRDIVVDRAENVLQLDSSIELGAKKVLLGLAAIKPLRQAYIMGSMEALQEVLRKNQNLSTGVAMELGNEIVKLQAELLNLYS